MSINIEDLQKHVIDPTLKHIGLYSKDASELLIMTALAESGASHLKQMGNGPAVGIYQMEPFTHDDCWINYLAYKKDIAALISSLSAPGLYGAKVGNAQEMAGNLYYATAMARIKYLRDRMPIPSHTDIDAMAAYHKRVYNSTLGKADPKKTADTYRKVRG